MAEPSPLHDAGHRLLQLVPVPTLWCGPRFLRPSSAKSNFGHGSPRALASVGGCGNGASRTWEAGYALSPATDYWSTEIRKADPGRPALAVGFVGATSAGKSWLIGKLQSPDGAKPRSMEELFNDSNGGATVLQSITSDVNMYTDPVNYSYYVDFEGTYGTQPLQLRTADICRVVQRCVDGEAWEHRRRQALKESVQPAVAYLMCNVVVFVTREKLVCRRTLEECEQFAMSANARVTSALPPALVIVQNCCRPSEGIFDTAECTAAFKQAHLNAEGAGTHWASYFRSIDCFCLPDEYTFCKRSGFDGEAVCAKVIDSLRETLRKRLAEGTSSRAEYDVVLSQLQWFSALSTLCSVVNEGHSVEMSAICVDAASSESGLSELKASLHRLMHPCARNSAGSVCIETFHNRLDAAVEIIARFAVLHGSGPDEVLQLVAYLLMLFPCGAVADSRVERFDGRGTSVPCGQSGLFHKRLHRSNVLVRTVDAGWLQGMSEWLQGGVTHAWEGDFCCHADVADRQNAERLSSLVREHIEEYKLEKCLAGVVPKVGANWILKAWRSLSACGLLIRRDPMRMCMVCLCRGQEQAGIFRIWQPQTPGNGIPTCDDCWKTLQEHGLVGLQAAQADNSAPQAVRCAACFAEVAGASSSGFLASLFGDEDARPQPESRISDHRLRPCRCVTCRECAERLGAQEQPHCPLCELRVNSISDERALLETGWYSTPPPADSSGTVSQCVPMCSRRLK